MASANLLKIFQWNCHSLNPKKGSLSRLAADYDILLLCETWLKPNINFHLSNFNIIRKDRDDRQEGDFPLPSGMIYPSKGWIQLLT